VIDLFDANVDSDPGGRCAELTPPFRHARPIPLPRGLHESVGVVHRSGPILSSFAPCQVPSRAIPTQPNTARREKHGAPPCPAASP
jgi:hypothetical protein